MLEMTLLDRVEIENFLGCARAQIDLPGLTVIAGGNASGKSSVENAIRLAMIAEIPRVALKKDYGQLVRSGAAFAAIKLKMQDGKEFSLRINKSGKADGMRPAKADPLTRTCLYPKEFALLASDERKEALCELLEVNVIGDKAALLLRERGVSAENIASMSIALTAGMPHAHAFAEAQLRDYRATWKAATGQNYGTIAAETWTPVMPETIIDIPATKKRIAKIEDASEKLLAQMGAEQAKPVVDAAHVAKLKAILDAPGQDIEHLTEQRELAISNLRATESVQRTTHFSCPQCNTALGLSAEGVVHQIEPMDAIGRDNLLALIDSMKNNIRDLTGEIAEANSAATRARNAALDLARLEGKGERDHELVVRLSAEIKANSVERDGLRGALREADGINAEIARLKDRAKIAGSAHTMVQVWTEIAWLCSPSGIPAELLQEALAGVNVLINKHCVNADFPAIAIDADADITIVGRPYALCSESEQWKADAVIAMTVAQLSGFGLVLLDRFDVLDVRARGAVVPWLRDGCASVRTVLFGTLKSPPNIEGAACYWMDGGKCVEMAEAA